MLLPLSLLCVFAWQAPAPAQPSVPTPREKAIEVLNAAFDSAPGAQPEVAALALVRIGENLEAVDHKKALAALTRAFDATPGIPPDQDGRREFVQSLVAGATVEVSLADAIDMLKRITVSASVTDDPRHTAINAAVSRLLQRSSGKNGADEAIELVNSVGVTGQYPFEAARQIFEHLPADDVRRPAIFAYSLSAYTLRPSEAFGTFLVRHWKEIPRTTAEAAVRQVVETILALKDEGLNESLEAANGSLTLHGRRNVELFDLMQVVREIDPKRAAEILDRNPELKAALERFPGGREALGVVGNSSRSEGNVEPGGRGSDMGAALAQLEKVEEGTPEPQRLAKYLEIARAIKTPAVRLELLSSLVSGAAASDPVTARSLLSECMELLKGSRDPALRSQVWASLAEAAHQIHDDDLAREALDQAFDDAALLVKLDLDPDEPNSGPRDMWPSTNAYRRIVISGVKMFGVNAETLLARVEDRDLNLFARVEMAQALLDRPHHMWRNWSGKTLK